MNSLIARKIEQSQKFLENGARIPVTKLFVDGNLVTSIKTPEKNMYSAIQLGFEKRLKRKPKSTKSEYLFLREVRVEPSTPVKLGDQIKASQIFKPGDVINVTGISKGKGYAGGVKRYHFRGGPRTHGQSDRERAPGAIGTSTTPGRVYKGKRMAGRMGHDKVTVKNLEIVEVNDSYILVKGLVPGGKNSILILKKVSENKKFIPLYADKEISEKVSEPKAPEEISEKKVEVKEDQKKEEVKKVEEKENAK